MPRYLYETVFIQPKPSKGKLLPEDQTDWAREELNRVLAGMAEDGWELAQMPAVPLTINAFFILIFKKPAVGTEGR